MTCWDPFPERKSTCPELPEGSFWNPDLGFRTVDLMGWWYVCQFGKKLSPERF